MIKQRFIIEDMHCTACVMTVDDALEELAGVKEADTSFARSRTEVTFDPSVTSAAQIVAAIRAAGYCARPA